jgi:hypothetical protein
MLKRLAAGCVSGACCGSAKETVAWDSSAAARKENGMSAFEDHKAELEHYEQMLGKHRGRLAVSLDRVTNAMILVGQHGVYCHSNRDPQKPAMDIQIIQEELRKAKDLIQGVMEELRQEREQRLRTQ